MTVGIKVDYLWFQIGNGEFLNAFFSTISYHLEPNGWGSKYPIVMKDLYNGNVSWEKVPELKNEIIEIRKDLGKISPKKVIWNYEDLEQNPPWRDNISPEITSLANYFVTSNGEDLFEVILKAIDDSYSEKIDLKIESI
jgi:hypothetical protein